MKNSENFPTLTAKKMFSGKMKNKEGEAAGGTTYSNINKRKLDNKELT